MARLLLSLFVPLFLMLPLGAAANERYETLLGQLAQSQTSAEAQALSGQIWQIWLTAPDEAAQAVLDAAMARRQAQDFLGAISELDRLIEGWPDYAEGWNQRATMYYVIGAFEASLADVDEVLAREPRHFGALSGKAVILARQGKTALAQLAVREALKFHPHLNERAILRVNPGQDL
jgi:tetratricopeptide (TPR) repeat protein